MENKDVELLEDFVRMMLETHPKPEVGTVDNHWYNSLVFVDSFLKKGHDRRDSDPARG